MPSLLFLSIDGVLNDRKPFGNGFYPIYPEKLALIDLILTSVPDCGIVIAEILENYRFSYLHEIETLFGSHGMMNVRGRIQEFMITEFVDRIGKKVDDHPSRDKRCWLAPKGYSEAGYMIPTNPDVGMTSEDAQMAIDRLATVG